MGLFENQLLKQPQTYWLQCPLKKGAAFFIKMDLGIDAICTNTGDNQLRPQPICHDVEHDWKCSGRILFDGLESSGLEIKINSFYKYVYYNSRRYKPHIFKSFGLSFRWKHLYTLLDPSIWKSIMGIPQDPKSKIIGIYKSILRWYDMVYLYGWVDLVVSTTYVKGEVYREGKKIYPEHEEGKLETFWSLGRDYAVLCFTF